MLPQPCCGLPASRHVLIASTLSCFSGSLLPTEQSSCSLIMLNQVLCVLLSAFLSSLALRVTCLEFLWFPVHSMQILCLCATLWCMTHCVPPFVYLHVSLSWAASPSGKPGWLSSGWAGCPLLGSCSTLGIPLSLLCKAQVLLPSPGLLCEFLEDVGMSCSSLTPQCLTSTWNLVGFQKCLLKVYVSS